MKIALPPAGRVVLRVRVLLFFAISVIANYGLSTRAYAQITSKQVTPTVCPSPAEVLPVQLYGLWRAEFDGAALPATALFEKHPELADSVSGGINRDGRRTLVAGDVDNGVFSLEESDNGQNITATWSGVVVEGSCGKEISGTWNKANSNTSQGFILRKQPGWR